MKTYLLLALVSCASLAGTIKNDMPAREIVASRLTVSKCEHDSPFDIPENKLIHFDSPGRIADSYLVGFQCDKVLASYVKNKNWHRLLVLPDTLPTSQANCAALASALANRYGGNVGSVWCRGRLRAFSIKGISEAKIADLAKDARVEYVEPDMVATTQ